MTALQKQWAVLVQYARAQAALERRRYRVFGTKGDRGWYYTAVWYVDKPWSGR